MDVEKARLSLYQASLSLKIMHHPDPAVESCLRVLEAGMDAIVDSFEELVI